MKFRLIFVIAMLALFAGKAAAQLTLIKELDFPEKAVLGDHPFHRFGYAVDGNWHVVSSIIGGQPQGLAYNATSGELRNTNYIVDDSWDFEGQRLYRGWSIAQPWLPWRYLRLLPNGIFTVVENVPAAPSAVSGSLAYGLNGRKVYEMEPFADTSRELFTVPDEINGSSLHLALEDGQLYIAHHTGILQYDLETDSLWALHPEYFASHDLEFIPWSGYKGRFLFKRKEPHPVLEIHEAGHGMNPRQIATGSNPPAVNPHIWFQSTPFQAPYVYHTHREYNISSAGDVTWFGFIQNSYNTAHTHYLFRIDRSEAEASLDELAFHERNLPIDFWLKPWIHALDNGNVVAMGLYGSEGIEPYGYKDGQLVVLKDFYEGARGSVKYVLDETLNGPTRWHRSMHWKDHLVFPVFASYYGEELAMSDGTEEGTRLLADIAPGIRGCRAFQFFQSEAGHFIMAQKEDHSIALYQLGEQTPPEVNEPISNPELEILLGNLSGTNFYLDEGNYTQAPQLLLNDGIITYLGHNADTSFFAYPGSAGAWLVNSILQLDIATGEVIRRKRFGPERISKYNDWFLLPGDDGGFNLIRSGSAHYQDENETINAHSSSSIHLTRFDENLNFKDISNIASAQPGFQRILFAGKQNDGVVVLAQRNGPRSNPLRLIKFDHEWEQVKTVDIPRIGELHERMEAWHDEQGILHVALYEHRSNCADCPLFIHRFDQDMNPSGTWMATFSGSLSHPRLHAMPNGERWFVAGLNGEILLPSSEAAFELTANHEESFGVFVYREIAELQRPLGTEIHEVEARKYFPSFSREGNVYLNYLRTALGSDDFVPIFGFENHFNVVHPFYYELAQLDGLGEISQYAELEVELSNLSRVIHFPQVFDAHSGTWLRGVKAGTWNVAYTPLHKHPRPAYHSNFGNRIQLFTDQWPFEPQAMPSIETLANEEGSHMHIFPNPNQGEFYIVPRDGANRVPYTRFYVQDMQGRLIEERAMASDFLYDRIAFTGSLNAGVYHVVFLGEEARESHRMVIIK